MPQGRGHSLPEAVKEAIWEVWGQGKSKKEIRDTFRVTYDSIAKVIQNRTQRGIFNNAPTNAKRGRKTRIHATIELVSEGH